VGKGLESRHARKQRQYRSPSSRGVWGGHALLPSPGCLEFEALSLQVVETPICAD
jgi:hypothetical protein